MAANAATDTTAAPLLRVVVAAEERRGLRQRSAVMIDKITTTPRTRLHAPIGRLSHEDMVRIDRGLLVFLGIAG
jgi:mRNA interferase MazF